MQRNSRVIGLFDGLGSHWDEPPSKDVQSDNEEDEEDALVGRWRRDFEPRVFLGGKILRLLLYGW